MKTKYDWSNVQEEIKYISSEIFGGVVFTWGYDVKPYKVGEIWLSGGNSYLIGCGLFKGDWQDSLEERPNESK